jgi:hypothetical protein
MTIHEEMERMRRKKLDKENSFEKFMERKKKQEAVLQDIEAYELYLREKKNNEVNEIITKIKKENDIS